MLFLPPHPWISELINKEALLLLGLALAGPFCHQINPPAPPPVLLYSRPLPWPLSTQMFFYGSSWAPGYFLNSAVSWSFPLLSTPHQTSSHSQPNCFPPELAFPVFPATCLFLTRTRFPQQEWFFSSLLLDASPSFSCHLPPVMP